MAVATVAAMAAVITRVAAVMVAVTTPMAAGIVEGISAARTSAVRISVVGVSAARTLAADAMRYERRVSEVPLSPAAT